MNVKETNAGSITDMIKIFINYEDENFSLYRHVNDIREEIERLEK